MARNATRNTSRRCVVLASPCIRLDQHVWRPLLDPQIRSHRRPSGITLVTFYASISVALLLCMLRTPCTGIYPSPLMRMYSRVLERA